MTEPVFKQFLHLPMKEKILLFVHAIRAPIYWFALRALGFKRFQEVFLDNIQGLAVCSDIEAAKNDAKLIDKAVRFLIGKDQCLLRSTMLMRTLKKKGYHPILEFGVNRNTNKFRAHCWVEIDNIPINDERSNIQGHKVLRSAKS